MIQQEIESINSFLKTKLWMDFEVVKMGCSKVVLCGFIDEQQEDIIRIEFELACMYDGSFSFTYDGEVDFISVVNREDAKELVCRYDVTEEYTIFSLNGISNSERFYIASRDIRLSYQKS